uniref:Secreted protein n=1 Tax=Physcomitrium patens TaxID=3218 RepID=A0A2K1JTU5_PHYPA|nr:hypothetical protein PHYPA_014725 [Physcomitrium patens]
MAFGCARAASCHAVCLLLELCCLGLRCPSMQRGWRVQRPRHELAKRLTYSGWVSRTAVHVTGSNVCERFPNLFLSLNASVPNSHTDLIVFAWHHMSSPALWNRF